MPHCQICSKRFSRTYNLQRHMERKHAQGDPSQTGPMKNFTFQHPFTLMSIGPTCAGRILYDFDPKVERAVARNIFSKSVVCLVLCILELN